MENSHTIYPVNSPEGYDAPEVLFSADHLLDDDFQSNRIEHRDEFVK